MTLARRDHSAAAPMALAWAALIVYASLFPFADWHWPPGAKLPGALLLPWPRWQDRFDLVANLLGYLPLGFLLLLTWLNRGVAAGSAFAAAVLLPSAGSYVLEVTQLMLPHRVPSLLDWALNSAGALLGALLAAWLHALGWTLRLRALRRLWVEQPGAGALTLLLLWPVGLLFPAPVPLGLGQVWEPLRPWLAEVLAGVPWAEVVSAWLNDVALLEPLGSAAEWLAISFGLFGPCLLAFALVRGVRRRLVLAFGLSVLGFGVTSLSAALNFGPEHALTWLTPASVPGLGTGLLLAVACLRVPPRLAAGLGLMVLTGLVSLVAHAPTDPYYAESLQLWEQGRFARFHGAAQWVGWLWPYVALAWLLGRVGARD